MTVVQDPDEALIPAMPISAMNYLEVDHVLSAARIGELIVTSSGSTFNGVPVMARNNADEPLERAMSVADSARVAHRQAQSIPDLLTTEAPDVPAKRTVSPPPRRRPAAPKRKQGRTRA